MVNSFLIVSKIKACRIVLRNVSFRVPKQPVSDAKTCRFARQTARSASPLIINDLHRRCETCPGVAKIKGYKACVRFLRSAAMPRAAARLAALFCSLRSCFDFIRLVFYTCRLECLFGYIRPFASSHSPLCSSATGQIYLENPSQFGSL